MLGAVHAGVAPSWQGGGPGLGKSVGTQQNCPWGDVPRGMSPGSRHPRGCPPRGWLRHPCFGGIFIPRAAGDDPALRGAPFPSDPGAQMLLGVTKPRVRVGKDPWSQPAERFCVTVRQQPQWLLARSEPIS